MVITAFRKNFVFLDFFFDFLKIREDPFKQPKIFKFEKI